MGPKLRRQGSVLKPRSPGQDLQHFDLSNAFEETRHVRGRKELTQSSFRLQIVVQLLWAFGMAGALLHSCANLFFPNSDTASDTASSTNATGCKNSTSNPSSMCRGTDQWHLVVAVTLCGVNAFYAACALALAHLLEEVSFGQKARDNPNRKSNETHEPLLARARRYATPRARWTGVRNGR